MFETSIKVRFNHVDFAGIVFYPRYFEMFNQVVEEWCENQLGYDFRRLHEDFNAGLPAAHIDVDFEKPSRLGEVLMFFLTVEHVGGSSLKVAIEASCNSDVRLKARLTMVYIVKKSSGEFVATEIPAVLKKRMFET